jgi:predicted transcriptional regulator of viral defense system
MAQIYTNTTTAREMDLLKWIKETFPEGVFRTQDLRFRPEVYQRWRDWPMILYRLRKKEWIVLLEKGKYVFGDLLSSQAGDSFVIGTRLISPSAIAYQSALNHYGWTEQIPNVVFVQTIKQKASKEILNVRYKFIKVRAQKFYGVRDEWSGVARYKITEPEKTIIDCFDLPQYAGGFVEAVKGLYAAHRDLDNEKLWHYAASIGNQTVMKRIAYLSELYDLESFVQFREKVLARLTKTYSTLDPLSHPTGKRTYRWKLLLNVSDQALLNMAEGIY